MTGNILKLVESDPASSNVVIFLEKILENARKGEYDGLSLTTVGADGSIRNLWANQYTFDLNGQDASKWEN